MFRGLIGVLMVGALATACAPADRVSLPGTMAVSPDFSPEQAEAIFAAADAWAKATGGVANLQPAIGNRGTVTIAPVVFDDDTEADTIVSASDDARIRVDLKSSEFVAHHASHVSAFDELQDTVMHELGHAFGLNHVPGGLMDPSTYGKCIIDDDTLARFYANYDVRLPLAQPLDKQ